MSDSQVANTDYANPFLPQDPQASVWQRGYDDAAAGKKQDHKALIDRWNAPAYRKGYAAGTITFLELGHAQVKTKSKQATETTKRNHAKRESNGARVSGKAKESWQRAIERQQQAEAELAGVGGGCAPATPGGSKSAPGGGTGTNGMGPVEQTPPHNFSDLLVTGKTAEMLAWDAEADRLSMRVVPAEDRQASDRQASELHDMPKRQANGRFVKRETSSEVTPSGVVASKQAEAQQGEETRTVAEDRAVATSNPVPDCIEVTKGEAEPAQAPKLSPISGRGHFSDKFRRALGMPARAELRPHRQRLVVAVGADAGAPVGTTQLWVGDEPPAGWEFAADKPYDHKLADAVPAVEAVAPAPEVEAPQPVFGLAAQIKLRTFALEMAVKAQFPGGETEHVTLERAKRFYGWCFTGDAK